MQADLGIDYLERLAAALEVHFEWLSRGTGPEELDADPPAWRDLPPAGRVALRVVTGRGGAAEEALERLLQARLPPDAGTQEYLRAIARSSRSISERGVSVELSPVVAQALGMLTARDPSKARSYAEIARGLRPSARESDPERVAAQIEGLASGAQKAR